MDGMSIFTWDQKYSVHNIEIDSQHRTLFSLADEFHRAMAHGEGRERIAQTLSRLIEYTQTHFASEEKLMLSSHYSEYRQHKQQHDDLTKQVLALKAQFDAGEATVTMDTMHFLLDWLDKHIRLSDAKIAKHVAEWQKGPAVARVH